LADQARPEQKCFGKLPEGQHTLRERVVYKKRAIYSDFLPKGLFRTTPATNMPILKLRLDLDFCIRMDDF